MRAEFICHPEFAELRPADVFRRGQAPLSAAEGDIRDRHILFRRKVFLPAAKRAFLRITADDYFKLYINGEYVAQGPPPSYPQHYYYMEIDVSSRLRAGENVFAVHTYYQGLINRVWVSGDLRACFWCELFADGKQMLVSDGLWRCSLHSGYSARGKIGYDTSFAVSYDSSAPEVGFEKPGFDDSAWGRAAVRKYADYRLARSPVPPLSVYTVPPAVLSRRGGVLFADFGAERAGQLRVEAKGRKGDRLYIRCGEELNPDGSVRFDMRCNCRYEEEWVLSGGTDVFDPYDYKGFRYAEIAVPEGAHVARVEMTVRHYPFEKRAVYETRSERLRQILKLCEDTVHYGTQEVFIDCPTREKGQYLGDLCISGRAQCVLTQDARLLKKSILDFCRSSSVSRGVMAVAPASFMQEIADYSLLFPALVLWAYKQDGDIGFLRQAWPCLRTEHEYFLRFCNAEGLLENVNEQWNMVDWPENLRDGYDFPLTIPVGGGVHNVINALWVGFLQAQDEIRRILGKPETGRTARAKEAFVSAFYSKEKGLFCDTPRKTHSAVHSNIFPLLFGIGTENEQIRQNLVGFICERGLSRMGVYMAYFALAALVKCGERERAERLAVDPRAWPRMLAEGATTAFEVWGKEEKWNTSLFHPWACAPLIVFAKGAIPY